MQMLVGVRMHMTRIGLAAPGFVLRRGAVDDGVAIAPDIVIVDHRTAAGFAAVDDAVAVAVDDRAIDIGLSKSVAGKQAEKGHSNNRTAKKLDHDELLRGELCFFRWVCCSHL